MIRKITRALAAAAVLTAVLAGAASAAPYAAFPPDPRGVSVIDRASFTVGLDSGAWYFYTVIYNSDTTGVMKIYGAYEEYGAENPLQWQELHTWQMMFEGDYVKLNDIEVIGIAQSDPEQPVLTFWTDSYVGYVEAAVHLALIYDMAANTFSTDWSD